MKRVDGVHRHRWVPHGESHELFQHVSRNLVQRLPYREVVVVGRTRQLQNLASNHAVGETRLGGVGLTIHTDSFDEHFELLQVLVALHHVSFLRRL
mgnify:CR=1 FL=1